MTQDKNNESHTKFDELRDKIRMLRISSSLNRAFGYKADADKLEDTARKLEAELRSKTFN